MKDAQNILTEQDPAVIYYGQSIRYTVLGADIDDYYGNPLYLDAFPVNAMTRRGS